MAASSAMELGDAGEGEGAEDARARKEKVIQSLTEAEALRKSDLSRRRSQIEDSKDPKESIHDFVEEFKLKCASIQGRISARMPPSGTLGPGKQGESVQGLNEEIAELGNSVARSTYFLPSYHLKTCQSAIERLKNDLENLKASIAPKKKFSFSSKSKSASIHQTQGESTTTPDRLEQPSFKSEFTPKMKFSNKQNETFMRLNANGEDFTFDHLSNCKIYLTGKLSALYIDSLKDCEVHCGPISGAVYIDHVENSVLVLAAHQIRIHNTTNTDFYLRVRSNPIIEFSTDVRFAPYIFHYENMQSDLQECGLSSENDLWKNVDDFRWLRATPSPNWKVIPPEERRGAASLPPS